MILFFGEKSTELEKLSFAIAEDIQAINNFSALKARLDESKEETIIIVSSEISLTDALSVAELVQLKYTYVRVILSRNRLDVDTLSRALRMGVAEVVSADDSSAFVKSVQHVRELLAKSRMILSKGEGGEGRAKVIVVFSAKGGCGKTTTAINLASALSLYPATKVCLIDLDLQFGDIAVSLQKKPEKTISSAIQMGNSIDRLGARSMITKFNENLDLLLAPNNPTDVEFISGEIVESILKAISSDYDFIVVDTPPAFTDFVIRSMELMDACFLVTTLDMPAIKNTKVVLETMYALKLDLSQVRLVVNRADSKTGISVGEVETLLERKVDFEIPNDTNVSVSTNQGVANIHFSPKSGFSKVFRKMAESLSTFFLKDQESQKKKSIFGIGK